MYKSEIDKSTQRVAMKKANISEELAPRMGQTPYPARHLRRKCLKSGVSAGVSLAMQRTKRQVRWAMRHPGVVDWCDDESSRYSWLTRIGDSHASIATPFMFNHNGDRAMSKSKDQKKQTKKEPAKTPKEKKDAKKVKKEERKRQ